MYQTYTSNTAMFKMGHKHSASADSATSVPVGQSDSAEPFKHSKANKYKMLKCRGGFLCVRTNHPPHPRSSCPHSLDSTSSRLVLPYCLVLILDPVLTSLWVWLRPWSCWSWGGTWWSCRSTDTSPTHSYLQSLVQMYPIYCYSVFF